jgi:hypothetical protein
MTGSAFDEALTERGWLVVPDAIEPGLLDEMAAQFEHADALRHDLRARAGVEGANDGTLHHLAGDHPSFLELLRRLRSWDESLRGFFGGNYILNSFGGVINRRDTSAYVHNIHRDIRFSSDSRRFMLNLLVMLDEFTLENGATYLLSGSHRLAERPAAPLFEREADRAVGGRGSVLFFDSRLWHAAGRNTTAAPRRALTITLSSPFFKPQLDYPRLLGLDSPAAGDAYLRQVVGYNARVPATLEEYYLPLAQRFYQRGQDD